jgi:threonine dehydrogenase-like Zn-dependent dehydrogenase
VTADLLLVYTLAFTAGEAAKEVFGMKGKVAALVGPEEVEVKEFDVPEPEPGAVLVKVRRANVCGSEVHIYHFHHPLIRECVLGHEFVGEIAALGEGVTTDYAGNPVQVGDRVIAPYYLTCRKCPACLRGNFNLCQRAYAFWANPPEKEPHFTGAFATHYYVHPDQYFYKVPDNVPDEVVAGANCGLTQVLFGLHQIGLTAGDSLVIQGAGGLGLYAAAVGSDMGAQVIVVEGIPERIELAKRFGAESAVDMREHETAGERIEQVKALTDGYGADVVLEVTGVPAAFVEGVGLARPGGTLVEIGNVSVGQEHEVSLAPGLITRKMLRVQGFVRYQPWFLHRALRFLERKHRDHPFDALSDREYGLEDVGEAIEREEGKKVARPAIVPA